MRRTDTLHHHESVGCWRSRGSRCCRQTGCTDWLWHATDLWPQARHPRSKWWWVEALLWQHTSGKTVHPGQPPSHWRRQQYGVCHLETITRDVKCEFGGKMLLLLLSKLISRVQSLSPLSSDLPLAKRIWTAGRRGFCVCSQRCVPEMTLLTSSSFADRATKSLEQNEACAVGSHILLVKILCHYILLGKRERGGGQWKHSVYKNNRVNIWYDHLYSSTQHELS